MADDAPGFDSMLWNQRILNVNRQELDLKDSMERPAGGTKDRAPGWKVYVNILDEADTKARIDAAVKHAKYIEDLYLGAPPTGSG